MTPVLVKFLSKGSGRRRFRLHAPDGHCCSHSTQAALRNMRGGLWLYSAKPLFPEAAGGPCGVLRPELLGTDSLSLGF